MRYLIRWFSLFLSLSAYADMTIYHRHYMDGEPIYPNHKGPPIREHFGARFDKTFYRGAHIYFDGYGMSTGKGMGRAGMKYGFYYKYKVIKLGLGHHSKHALDKKGRRMNNNWIELEIELYKD